MEVPVLAEAQSRARNQIRQHDDVPAAPVEAVTAFLVYVTPDGRYVMDTNLDAPVTAARTPTRHEVIAASACVINDIQRQMATEEMTMNILGNLSRMQADPQYQLMIEQARAQAAAAAAAAAAANGH